MVFTFGLDPVIGYDGGELTIDAPLPVYTFTDDGEKFYYVDADKNKVPEEEAVERLTRYYNEQPKITFESFEEFKPYIKECIDLNIALYPMENPEYEDVYRKESYDEVVELWEAVIDNNYKTLPAGTSEKWQAQFDTPAEAVWEIDHDKVQAIAPYAKEYNIYDEQLDTNLWYTLLCLRTSTRTGHTLHLFSQTRYGALTTVRICVSQWRRGRQETLS